jgi:hypothetical protein
VPRDRACASDGALAARRGHSGLQCPPGPQPPGRHGVPSPGPSRTQARARESDGLSLTQVRPGPGYGPAVLSGGTRPVVLSQLAATGRATGTRASVTVTVTVPPPVTGLKLHRRRRALKRHGTVTVTASW